MLSEVYCVVVAVLLPQQAPGFVCSQVSAEAFSAQHGFGQSGGQGFPQQPTSTFSLSETWANAADSALEAGHPPQPIAGQTPIFETVSVAGGSLLAKLPNKTIPINKAVTTPPTITKFI